jgi:3-phenylpropionate/trans-cinnamate dioxygenase ferredoxin reductase subunit
MSETKHDYVIVGAGLAGVSAAEGIREIDSRGSILLIGSERHLPYDRPPLSKKLWLGKKTVADIILHDPSYYESAAIDLALEETAVGLDRSAKAVTTDKGHIRRYRKLLLATGGNPRALPIPGGDLADVCYYRRLDDYQKIRQKAAEGSSAVVIGGGFIGSEMAAALCLNRVRVTMIFPEPRLISRVFPGTLGKSIQDQYREHGIDILSEDAPTAIEKADGKLLTRTRNGKAVVADIVIAGIGIAPNVGLARFSGLVIGDGIEVDSHLSTVDPDVFAAGDNASFPNPILERKTRMEHWDNALNQGKHAGRNMAGASVPFTYQPYFFSDLFDFGFEAVGETDSRLETVTDWQKENSTGVIYYLKEKEVRGVMLCNVWDKVDQAREMIRRKEKVIAGELKGKIG